MQILEIEGVLMQILVLYCIHGSVDSKAVDPRTKMRGKEAGVGEKVRLQPPALDRA